MNKPCCTPGAVDTRSLASLSASRSGPPFRKALRALALVLAFSACDGGVPEGPTFVQRDSAGITIAENTGTVAGEGGGWAISPEPILQIGAMEGDEAYELFRVWGAARLSDGRIAVVNNRAPDVRVYSAAGRHLHTFGTRGEGPGEFDSPVLVGVLPGDTLVVVDRLLRRVNLYHPEEGFIRGAVADPGIEGYLLTVGMFSSGSVLIRRSIWQEDMPNGFFRFPVQYFSVGLDGTIEHDFGEYPGDETMFSTREVDGGTMALSSGAPFGKGPTVAVAGGRFFYGSQDRYEFQVHDQGGRLNRIIRRDMAPTAVTDAHVAAVMEEMADDAESDDQAREFRRMFRDAPIPETHPAHGSIHADALGFLWVEEYRLPGDDTRVTTIFDPEGRMVGSVVLPDRFRVEEIGEDYILGRYADDLGVEYLRLYELTRPGNDLGNRR